MIPLTEKHLLDSSFNLPSNAFSKACAGIYGRIPNFRFLNLSASAFPAACRWMDEPIQMFFSLQNEDSPTIAAGSFNPGLMPIHPPAGMQEFVQKPVFRLHENHQAGRLDTPSYPRYDSVSKTA
ncbi:hypothetical protein JW906_00990 [bacterium]|nr:hypothetical protein [bacterium]